MAVDALAVAIVKAVLVAPKVEAEPAIVALAVAYPVLPAVAAVAIAIPAGDDVAAVVRLLLGGLRFTNARGDQANHHSRTGPAHGRRRKSGPCRSQCPGAGKASKTPTADEHVLEFTKKRSVVVLSEGLVNTSSHVKGVHTRYSSTQVGTSTSWLQQPTHHCVGRSRSAVAMLLAGGTAAFVAMLLAGGTAAAKA
jgi:hypothetical protein